MDDPTPASRAAALAAALLAACAGFACTPVRAADQTVPGAGNAAALELAQRSPQVRAAQRFLVRQAGRIRDSALRRATQDILLNPGRCALHRRGLETPQAQEAVIAALFEQGLINRADAAAFAPGVRPGVFPPLADAEGDCPRLPQPMESAPGSAFGGHHSYPGGLPVHEANNERSDVNLAAQYQASYGSARGGLPIDADVIIAAPIWHDWAKTLVFQWNADGSEFSEFSEFNFGGGGTHDAWGAAGDSRTGAHHILSVAESMARGLSPLLVVTQASAHAAPSPGNEFKVVNWLRAAALIARIDAVQAGYLARDAAGRLRLPPLGGLGGTDGVDLAAAGQVNLRLEYVLHNLSDADYGYSGPAVAAVDLLLRQLAPEFGIDPGNAAAFNTRFRNPVLSRLSAERLFAIYGGQGLPAVRRELDGLRRSGAI